MTVKEFLYKPEHKKGKIKIKFVILSKKVSGCHFCKLGNGIDCHVAKICGKAQYYFFKEYGYNNIDVYPLDFFINDEENTNIR